MQRMRKIKVVNRGSSGTTKAAVRCPMRLSRKTGYTVERIFTYCPDEFKSSRSALRNCFNGVYGWTPKQLTCAEEGVKAMLADKYHKAVGESLLARFAIIRQTYKEHRENDTDNVQRAELENRESSN